MSVGTSGETRLLYRGGIGQVLSSVEFQGHFVMLALREVMLLTEMNGVLEKKKTFMLPFLEMTL